MNTNGSEVEVGEQDRVVAVDGNSGKSNEEATEMTTVKDVVVERQDRVVSANGGTETVGTKGETDMSNETVGGMVEVGMEIQGRVIPVVESSQITRKDKQGMNESKNEVRGVVEAISMSETELRQKFGGGICEEPGREDKKVNNKKKESGYKPFTHITINTGHSYLVPLDNVSQEERDVLRYLVKAGGGAIPGCEGFFFQIHSLDQNSCLFTVLKDGEMIVGCAFDNCPRKSSDAWVTIIRTYSDINGVSLPTLKQPEGAWLADIQTDSLSLITATWIASFEQAVADTWRRLSPAERSNIRRKEIMKDSIRQSSFETEVDNTEIERIARNNACLKNHINHHKEINRVLKNRVREMDGLKQDVERLTSEVSVKDSRIAVLENEIAVIKDDFQRNVDAVVGTVRKNAEEFEFNAQLAQEERDEALQRVSRAERIIKHYERVMRTHGLDPLAFSDDRKVA